jgi:transposase
MKKIHYVGMDVHKETVSMAVLTNSGPEVVMEKTLPNENGALRRWFKKLSENGRVITVYEAGCCGYTLQRFLEKETNIPCLIVAPGKVPRKPGDRVKTDKRDAVTLARLLRSGEAESIHVLTAEDEAVRDYLRAREDLRVDLLRNRQRLLGFLLRHGYRYTEGGNWTQKHERWLKDLELPDEISRKTLDTYLFKIKDLELRLSDMETTIEQIATQERYKEKVAQLRCFKGIDTLIALSVICEIGDFRRFASAGAFMSFLGIVPREHSSGQSRRQGRVTKAGNGHLRRLLTEAAWHYRFKNPVSVRLAARRAGCSASVVFYADKARLRLQKKFSSLLWQGKSAQVAVTATARELSGFIWGAMTGNIA